jgi:peptidoglycan/xylan/chitin deacetylase (PgdA/CDA1 family)
METQISEKKQIAITFDDGPNPVYTPMLLDGLRERNVKAAFFLLGEEIEQYPDLVKQMYEDGHEIGCHSYEHVNLNLLSEADACAQVQKVYNLIYEITGNYPSFIRPPYGEWLDCLSEDFCMIPVLWDIDPLDWATNDASLVTDRVLEAVEEYDIILLHDASESSVQAAFQIIDELQKEGYEFVLPQELFFP